MEKPSVCEVVSFGETPVLEVLLPEKWTLKQCLYGTGNKLSYPH